MKKIIYILIVGALFACNSETKTNTNGHSSDEGHAHHETVVLNAEQISVNGYQIGSPTRQPFGKGIKTTGVIDLPPSNRHIVSNYLPGYAKKINVIVGDHVKKGQVLATIEDPGILELQEKYAKAESRREYLEQEFERQSQLFEDNIVSKKDFLEAKSNFKFIEAEAKSLKEQLRLINLSPEQVLKGELSRSYPIYAPANGIIATVNITTGEWVGNNKPLLSMVDPDHIHLELQVFEKDIQNLEPGQQIEFGLHGSTDHPYKAHIYLIGAEVKDDRRVLVHAHPDSSLKKLTIGAYVDGMIHLSSDTLLSLPNTAVTSLGDKTFALRVIQSNDGGYQLEQTPIHIIRENGKYVAIDQKWKTDQFLLTGVFDLVKEAGAGGGHSH